MTNDILPERTMTRRIHYPHKHKASPRRPNDKGLWCGSGSYLLNITAIIFRKKSVAV